MRIYEVTEMADYSASVFRVVALSPNNSVLSIW